ncbi:glutamine--tRNA ligase [Megasphaera sp.]|uniref:glutamine--tRNA ligase n=1 Tax=Megasphaera sp. TaxID=2023260 RepID=UPI003079CB34
MDNETTKNFIETIIDEDNEKNTYGKRVHTRFPPEPNGYLHIGHAKSICLNFGIAKKYGGITNLRFDDTNPSKENTEYVESIKRDVKWLGFDWDDRMFYASDYFDKLYEYAKKLIRLGKAYVDDLSSDEIREYRGTFNTPGKESPCRNRSVEENLQLFEDMKAGKFADGEKVLRAKIDMASPNLNMRDPVLYRIVHASHHRTGDKWCIYPMYDFAHPVSDAIERITHSICTLEFEAHRPLYNWVLEDWDDPEGQKPRQIEFARLNVTNMITSKRKLRLLVEKGIVSGWDDPRMPTISGIRRRGYTPESIRDFCERIGVAKADSMVDISLLEYCIREDLKMKAPRLMTVIDPIKVVLTNYPVIKDEDGNIVELHCTYDPESKSGSGANANRKVKGTLHWVNAEDAVDVETRVYDYLLKDDGSEEEGESKDFLDQINPHSLDVYHSKAEKALATYHVGDKFQFLRQGYFVIDPDTTADHLVVNRIVGLRDTWAKMQKKKKQ